jgi:hypothetical protein
MITLGLTGIAVVGWMAGWVEGQTAFLAILVSVGLIESVARDGE